MMFDGFDLLLKEGMSNEGNILITRVIENEV